MSDAKGLLLVTMEPPPALEEEFNDWYDNEHVPERAAIPGFETAMRFVCVSGWPRYLALYDLEHLSVLESDGYRAVSGTRFSPWSKRVLGRVRGQCRMAAEQVHPRHALTGTPTRLLFVRFAGVSTDREDALIAAVCRSFEGRVGVTAIRVFREPTRAGPRYLALIESFEAFAGVEWTTPLDDFGQRIDLVNEYARYWTRGELHGVYDAH